MGTMTPNPRDPLLIGSSEPTTARGQGGAHDQRGLPDRPNGSHLAGSCHLVPGEAFVQKRLTSSWVRPWWSTQEVLAFPGIHRIVENFHHRGLLRLGKRAQSIGVGATEANGGGVSCHQISSDDDSSIARTSETSSESRNVTTSWVNATPSVDHVRRPSNPPEHLRHLVVRGAEKARHGPKRRS